MFPTAPFWWWRTGPEQNVTAPFTNWRAFLVAMALSSLDVEALGTFLLKKKFDNLIVESLKGTLTRLCFLLIGIWARKAVKWTENLKWQCTELLGYTQLTQCIDKSRFISSLALRCYIELFTSCLLFFQKTYPITSSPFTSVNLTPTTCHVR